MNVHCLRAKLLTTLLTSSVLVGCTAAGTTGELPSTLSSPPRAQATTATARGRPSFAPASRAASPAASMVVATDCGAAVQPVPSADPNVPWTQPVPVPQPDWNDPTSYIAPPETQYWAVDQPQARSPQAFGVLPPPVGSMTQRPQVTTYELRTRLPTVPQEAPVYLVGQYPPAWSEVIARLVDNDPGWSTIPQFSYLAYEGPAWPSDSLPISTAQEAAQRATELLELLAPDAVSPTSTRREDGSWLVTFTRVLGDLPLVSDRPLRVWLNDAGQVTTIQGRRRPLLATSAYPLRSPERAWLLLQQGCGFGLNLPGYPSLPPTLGQFTIDSIELAYVETHVNRPQEVWLPYYVFRNDADAMIVVPAVDDRFIAWPKLRS